jgi:hypothetical protein
MGTLDGKLRKLERSNPPIQSGPQELDADTQHILQQLAICQLHHGPDMARVTEADTDPETFEEIRRTLDMARSQFEPMPPPSPDFPPPRAAKPRRVGRAWADETDQQADLVHTLNLVRRAIVETASQSDRMGDAIEAARQRLTDG